MVSGNQGAGEEAAESKRDAIATADGDSGPNRRIFQLASDEVTTIAGMRGAGKTVLAKFVLSKFQNVYVWDPQEEYGEFPHYVPETGSVEEFDWVCRHIWEHGNIVFAVEESEGWLGEGRPFSPYAFKVVLRGRNRGIGLIAITKRIALLSKSVFALSNHCFLFRFFAPNDIKYCAEFIGKVNASRLQQMPKFRFIYYGAEGQVMECPPLSI